MNTRHELRTAITLAGVLALLAASASADTFGTAGNEFAIDFVKIGNAGNADDSGAGGGIYFTPYGGVPYDYRIGIYEIPQNAITKATASGLLNVIAGAWTGERPAAAITWFDAAAFVNWLNTSTGHVAAYQLDAGATTLTLWSREQAWQAGGENLYRNKDAYYFLPSDDEWYKAAFHKNDGVTANYWDYATGSNTAPDGIDFNGDTTFDAVVDQGFNQGMPNDVTNAGVASPYGTFGQDGNVYELLESSSDGSNDNLPSPDESRAVRGGDWSSPEDFLRSSARFGIPPSDVSIGVGFRVASAVPEPSSPLLLLGSGWMGLLKRRRTPWL